MCEADVQTVIAHPRAMICTDSGVAPKGTSFHPRLKASFPRAIARYVREKGVVSLPEMIRKMTAMPASVYGLKTKGLVWEGMDADLCIFDPETFRDCATFQQPDQRCCGLDHVIVGGKVAAVDAVATGELGGKLLYRDV
jgi:N-acyl-D-aspartate/D-glutamate deacylase